MRTLTDANGLAVTIDVIRGEDAYASMLEGTAYLARRFRLMTGRKLMETPGQLVHGLAALERELEEIPKDTLVWPPNERWTARLITETDSQLHLRSWVLITWYQSAEDPMVRLTEIVNSIYLEQYLQQESVDLD